MPSSARRSLLAFLLFAAPGTALAGPPQGAWSQSDTLGMNLVSWNVDTSKTTTVSDTTALSEFIGIHYFFIDNVRLGVNLQFTEYLSTPKSTQSRLATFAVLPQIGWHFAGPFYAAFVLTIAPWTGGVSNFVLGVQGVLGVGIPLAERVKLTLAIEVPVNFGITSTTSTTIGFTPLLGISIRL